MADGEQVPPERWSAGGRDRYFDERLRGLEEQVTRLIAQYQSTEAATRLASINLDHRLLSMNELRDQINQERGHYVTQDVFRADSRAMHSEEETFQRSIDGRLRLIETVLANYAGRLWAVGMLGSIASVLASLVINFLFRGR